MKGKRNIQNIAPFLADGFVEFDGPIFDIGTYSSFLNENSDRLGNLNKYLIGKLHDSLITEFEVESDKLRMNLSDFSTHVFTDAIVEKFEIDIEHENLVFPIILELKGDLNVDFLRVKENGTLESIDQISIDEYLGEQILNLSSDLYEIAFKLWHSNPNENFPGESILMIVSAKELELTENQAIAWNKIFDNKYCDYYEYFREQFESGRYVSDYSVCLQLVDEFEGKIEKPTAQHGV